MKKIVSFLIVIISLFMFINVRAIDDEPENPVVNEPVVDPVVEPTVDQVVDPEPEKTEPEPVQQPVVDTTPIVVQPKPVVQTPKVETKKEEVVTTTIEEETSLLTGIESKIVKIALRENVYEYNVTIDSDIEELDLEPIKKDNNTTIEISTQVIKNLKDNKITITVKNKDKVETYIINVRVRKQIKEEVKIEKTNYKIKYLAFILIFGIIIVACVIFMKRENRKG